MKLVIGSKSGQLCNRLFAFCHFIANAIEYGYELYNPNFDEYCSYFKSTSKDDFGGYPISVKKKRYSIFKKKKISNNAPFWVKKCLYFSPFHKILIKEGGYVYNLRQNKFLRFLDTQRIIVAYGWIYKDEISFIKHAHLLKKFFEPVEEHSIKVSNFIKSCRKKDTALVGIHMRRGDYKTHREGVYYYDDSVYYSKMKQMKKLLNKKGKDVTFLICSNEPHNGKFKGIKTVKGPGHIIEDLYCLSKCDYLIGPPSTYTFWASFYGNVPLLKIKKSSQKILLNDFTVCQH